MAVEHDRDAVAHAHPDLSEFPALRATTEQAEAYGRQMIAALIAIRDCRHPTIAAIEGLCVGGGLEIALMCDLRLGAADSRYGVPIQKVGVAMPYPELAIFIQMLGRPTMLALLLEGQLHDAAWAERRGLLTRIAADLEADLSATIGRILTGSPVSHRHHKLSPGWPPILSGGSIRRMSALLRGGGDRGLSGRDRRLPRAPRPQIPRQLKH